MRATNATAKPTTSLSYKSGSVDVISLKKARRNIPLLGGFKLHSGMHRRREQENACIIRLSASCALAIDLLHGPI